MFFCAAILFSCKDAGVSNQYSSWNYVPAEVVVGFVDTVNYAFVRSFISDMKLTEIPMYRDTSFYCWIQVDSGTADQYIESLQKFSAIHWAVEENFDRGDPSKSYIFARFRDTVRIEDALTLIRSIKGISWKQTEWNPIFVLLSVKPGQENLWIKRFKTYPFIRSAQLNYRMYLD